MALIYSLCPTSDNHALLSTLFAHQQHPGLREARSSIEVALTYTLCPTSDNHALLSTPFAVGRRYGGCNCPDSRHGLARRLPNSSGPPHGRGTANTFGTSKIKYIKLCMFDFTVSTQGTLLACRLSTETVSTQPLNNSNVLNDQVRFEGVFAVPFSTSSHAVLQEPVQGCSQ